MFLRIELKHANGFLRFLLLLQVASKLMKINGTSCGMIQSLLQCLLCLCFLSVRLLQAAEGRQCCEIFLSYERIGNRQLRPLQTLIQMFIDLKCVLRGSVPALPAKAG